MQTFNWHKRSDDLPVRLCEEYYVATSIVGSAVVGAGATAISSSNNSKATANAAQLNNNRLTDQYNTTRSDLQTYNAAGINAADDITDRLQALTTPISMDQNTLEQTPGYQFNLNQGLKSVQNSAAARGLGASGAAQKGAATFATGLADSTYQNQFNNANTNQTNAYNRLMGVMGVGENAAAQTGVLNNQTTQAQVANTTGATNSINSNNTAIANAIGGAANNIGGYYAYSGLYGSPAQSSGAGTGYQGAFSTNYGY